MRFRQINLFLYLQILKSNAMTEQVFIQQFSKMPEAMKQERMAYFEYLMFKYKLKSQLSEKKEKGENVAKKPLKAGFLKGTFVLADDFDAPILSSRSL